MSEMTYLYLAIAILTEVCATSMMKFTDGFTRSGASIVTIVGYAIAFYFLSLTVRTLPTAIVYAIWSGAGIVLVALAAWLLHGQKVDAPAALGMGLIILGILVINLFSKSHQE